MNIYLKMVFLHIADGSEECLEIRAANNVDQCDPLAPALFQVSYDVTPEPICKPFPRIQVYKQVATE